MRCAIGEVDMHMIDLVAREEICEIKGIACTQRGLDSRPVFALVLLN